VELLGETPNELSPDSVQTIFTVSPCFYVGFNLTRLELGLRLSR
jgi:hypothetical protein